ncbi:MAG: HU family DNA-binding protein [Galactobacillus timonensis]|jgi:DNA-binding protein HU-beta|uniref:HU family DNA-binding protein n=1 Tax=Galactobacillus timonensis TaxID=2041840 RepID=UPI000C851E8C|nr:HU family DNA-binding protein [Galactobacillus timonensis]MDY5222672.1 HU family DNA-binding protein [Lachnospiraceae bacterium]MDY6282629.1 HU family DNA-binding protein [Erysipelotrichaceae bacterium]MCI6068214.1 HU family DNA-binding protein [Galactobacillus timonensis]MDD5851144.1 HU family DNA-binding protein [Galactobacillus timonensis]MDD6599615.1 HU family DNA-binding protein [Galactobacillus timonensis]
METVNKKSISEKIAEDHNLTKKEAGDIVSEVFELMTAALKDGNKVDITGFGKFEVKTRAAREGINPQTKEKIEIPASKIPGFKASKSLKDEVR